MIVRDGSVLLVDFDDDGYIHTNLPGGGVDEGESLHAALRREVMEETAAEVAIGPMLFAVEYDPGQHPDEDDPVHKLKLHFRCTLLDGSEPRFPDTPDPMETGVRWVPLDELDGAELAGARPAGTGRRAAVRPVLRPCAIGGSGDRVAAVPGQRGTGGFATAGECSFLYTNSTLSSRSDHDVYENGDSDQDVGDAWDVLPF